VSTHEVLLLLLLLLLVRGLPNVGRRARQCDRIESLKDDLQGCTAKRAYQRAEA